MNDKNDEIKSIDDFSTDLEKMNKEKLKSVFPECFVEDKLDIDKLLGLCGEYIIEDFEKYSFEWKGKSECLQLAQKRSMGALRPCPEESVDFKNTNNIYIEGDNLEVLKLLQVAYFNKVKMIYLDPPTTQVMILCMRTTTAIHWKDTKQLQVKQQKVILKQWVGFIQSG